jgi:glycosyltransferase involved in cell wall biosynthesis
VTASVCLCTYNGGRYLEELLDSLAAQTLLPVELLVGDDGSSDDTLEILRGFAADAPFPVEIFENERRLGPASNLEGLLARASGDILFPCDQDDIWTPRKIERLACALAESPDHGAALCNSSFIDARGRPLPSSLFEQLGLVPSTRQLVASGSYDSMMRVFLHNIAASHALALRRSALELVLPFVPCWYADWWIALVLSATTGITVLDDRLVAYRLHEANAIGVPADRHGLSTRASFETAVGFSIRADALEAAVARVDELRPGMFTPANRVAFEELAAHLRTRGLLPARRVRRLVPILREAIRGRYRRLSNGWRSAVVDLVRKRSAGRETGRC